MLDAHSGQLHMPKHKRQEGITRLCSRNPAIIMPLIMAPMPLILQDMEYVRP
jgi:hypothetical protein